MKLKKTIELALIWPGEITEAAIQHGKLQAKLLILGKGVNSENQDLITVALGKVNYRCQCQLTYNSYSS